MYAYIKGNIVSVGEGSLIIENNGIGYLISVSSNCIGKFGVKGESAMIYTYLHVREDDMSLYGFYSTEEKNMFLKLISVSGVGPKLALGVLSGLNLNDLTRVIYSSDIKTLSTVKGVGKKTAERIILELRGNLESGGEIPPINSMNDSINDAIVALTDLGISRQEAYAAVTRASLETDDTAKMIALALRSLVR